MNSHATDDLGHRLETAVAQQQRFLRTLSHELRTPLTTVIGYVELVLDLGQHLDPAQRRHLETALRTALGMSAVVEDLVALHRLDTEAVLLATAPTPHSELISAAAAHWAGRFDEEGISLLVDVAEPAALVEADPAAVDRLLGHLLSNAVKFTPRGGVVRLAGRVEGPRAVIEVTDSGPGVPADEHQQVFERFHRTAHAIEQAVPGIGLGLTLARSIARAHGGDVTVAGRESGGCRVTVHLPLSQPAVTATGGHVTEGAP